MNNAPAEETDDDLSIRPQAVGCVRDCGGTATHGSAELPRPRGSTRREGTQARRRTGGWGRASATASSECKLASILGARRLAPSHPPATDFSKRKIGVFVRRLPPQNARPRSTRIPAPRRNESRRAIDRRSRRFSSRRSVPHVSSSPDVLCRRRRLAHAEQVRIAADEQLSDGHSRRRLNDLAKFVTGEFLEIGAGGDDRAGAGVLE